jgi:hypothetical protein
LRNSINSNIFPKAGAETVFKECLAYKSAESKQIEALGPKAALESALFIAQPLTQLLQNHKHQDVLNPQQANAIGARLGTHVPGQDYGLTLDSALSNDLSHRLFRRWPRLKPVSANIALAAL